jgi:PAS domain S-box-containing protein
MLDPDGYITSWNVGAERIKGYLAGEIIGEHVARLYTPEDRAAGKPAQDLEAAGRSGRVEDEGWRVRKDGARFWANTIITALLDGNGRIRGFAKVTRDLTERRAREEAERRAALLEEASRVKDDFLAVVSHELRTPLNVILGQVTRLRSGKLGPEDAGRAWDSLSRNVQLQARIIEDLLDVSRIVTGKLSLRSEPVDIDAVAKEAGDEIQTIAAVKGVHVTATCESHARVLGDPVRLRQILANLLSNGVKFTPAGGRVELTCRRQDTRVLLQVTDTGIGIAPNIRGTLFDRFTQADSSVRRESGGLGLGLAIARELVGRHGGTIEAHSPGAGQGATFTVRLPAIKD